MGLSEGFVHPMDVLMSTGLWEQLSHIDWCRNVHVNAKKCFPRNYNATVGNVFHVLNRGYQSATFVDRFILHTYAISKFLDPSVFPFVSHYTVTDTAGFVTAPQMFQSPQHHWIDVHRPCRMKASDWNNLHVELMDAFGVSLVHIFFPFNGFIRRFTRNQDKMDQAVARMQSSLPKDDETPWLSFLVHPFFRNFMPKMIHQPQAVRQEAITNCFFGARNGPDFLVDFSLDIRHMRVPHMVLNRSLINGANPAVWLGVSCQETYNQRLIADDKGLALYQEYMQVRVVVYVWFF